jgi:hypothetical protein
MDPRDWHAIPASITCVAALIFIALIVVGAW